MVMDTKEEEVLMYIGSDLWVGMQFESKQATINAIKRDIQNSYD